MRRSFGSLARRLSMRPPPPHRLGKPSTSGRDRQPRLSPSRVGAAGRGLTKASCWAVVGALLSLGAGCVMKLGPRPPDGQTRMDIVQLSAAVYSFRTKFGVPYLPSRIKLS